MKKLMLLLAAGFSLGAIAQTDTTMIPLTATYTSLSSLNRADIERLPATTFMALVQGAFPFLGNVSNVEEEYTFLVEGFVAINPNAINLSQIESIHFYPAGTDLSRGSLGKKGTFVIRMKPQKSGFDVSTKTGLLLAAANRASAGSTDYGTGTASLNELSYRRHSNRSFLSSAVSYLHNGSPGLTLTRTNSKIVTNTNENRFRLSNVAGLQWGRRWSLDGALLLTTQPQKVRVHASFQPGPEEQDQRNTRHSLYASAHAGLRFSPSARWSNRLAVEASYAETKADESSNFFGNGISSNRNSATDQFQRYYAVTNHLTWKPVSTSAINLEASLVARYRRTHGSEDNLTMSSSGSNFSQSGRYQQINSRSFAVSPNIILQLYKFLTAEVGATYDDYGHSLKGNKTYKKLLPNAGLRFDLASLLPGSEISTLEFSSTYQKYMSSYDRMDLLGARYRSNLPAFNPFGTIVFPNPDAAIYTPSKVWVSSLAFGWWQNRIVVKGSYRIHDEMINTFSALPYVPNTAYVFRYEPLTNKNWSVELKAAVLQKPSANWTLTAMVFHDKYERSKVGNSPSFSTPSESLYLDAGKAPLRGGLRTALTLRRFYLQAAALVNLNEVATVRAGTVHEDRTTYRTNFLLAGYRWPLQGKAVKEIEANLQSHGLLQSGANVMTRYAGLGIHVRF